MSYLKICIFLAVVISSCNDTMDSNIVSADLNGEKWNAKVTAAFDSAFGDTLITLSAKSYSKDGFLRQNLGFVKIPPRPGVYSIVHAEAPHEYSGIGSIFTEHEGDGHVVSEIYYIDSTQNNILIVESYNQTTNALFITFTSNYKTRNNNQLPELFANFDNGKIETIVE